MSDDFHKLPRLYVDDAPLASGGVLTLEPAQSHYLVNVLRLKEGALLRLFNGRAGEWLARIETAHKKSVVVAVEKPLRAQKEKARRIGLIFAPIKKQRMDFLIEKAVELGVDDFYPALTRYTEMRKINAERINAQIIEAAEQCERLDLPWLHPMRPLGKLVPDFKGQRIFAALERREGIASIGEALEKTGKNENIFFLVGPEGGFAPEEALLFEQYENIFAVSLGERILRAETAALYCLAVCGALG